MKLILPLSALTVLALTACTGPEAPEAPTSAAVTTETSTPEAVFTESGAEKITWEALMPEGEEERLTELYLQALEDRDSIEEGSAGDVAFQVGTYTTVPELDGKTIRLPGYTVPFAYGADVQINEFLLVPYYGACLHAPPPPPNQTIYVSSEKSLSLGDLAQAVWIEGTLHARKQETELAGAAYTVELTSIEPY